MSILRNFQARLLRGPAEQLNHRVQRYYSSGSKPRVVVLGTGWSSFSFVHSLDRTLFDVTIVR
jgi:hypothetical protein